MSTNAALRPSSRLRTLPLKMLPTRRSSVVRSMLNSSSLPSSSTATRVSSVSALMTTSLWIFFSGRMSRWTFLTRLVAATLMVSRMPFGGSLISTGSNGFSSSTWAGVSRCGSRNSFLAGAGSAVSVSGAPCGGRPAAMFSARSISWACRFSNSALRSALFAHHVGARLDGFAVGFLRCLAEAAFGAETHSAAPP